MSIPKSLAALRFLPQCQFRVQPGSEGSPTIQYHPKKLSLMVLHHFVHKPIDKIQAPVFWIGFHHPHVQVGIANNTHLIPRLLLSQKSSNKSSKWSGVAPVPHPRYSSSSGGALTLAKLLVKAIILYLPNAALDGGEPCCAAISASTHLSNEESLVGYAGHIVALLAS